MRARRLLVASAAAAPCALGLAAAALATGGAGLDREARVDAAEQMRLAIGAAGACLLLAGALLGRTGRGDSFRRSRDGLLVLLAVATLWVWWYPHGGKPRAWLHAADAYHYYVGSKYFPELGYERLYACALVADAEAAPGADLAAAPVRDLGSNRIGRAADILADPEGCKRHFEPDRWEGFARDVAFFRTRLGPASWAKVRTDHGYNAPPAWTLVGSALANTGPAELTRVLFLTALDPLLLTGMFGAIAWAFGWRSMCVALLFWGTNQPGRWEWTGGAILRWDWLVAAVAGICCLRRGRPATAGILLAWASCVRIFPAAIPAVVAGAALLRMLRERRRRPSVGETRFLVAVTAAVATFVALSAAVVGPASWRDFARNSQLHLGTDTVNRIGLPALLAHDPDARLAVTFDPGAPDPYGRWKRERANASRDRRPLLVGAVLGYLALLAVALARQPDWVAAVLGVGLIPIALQLGGYYQAILVAYALLWSRREAIGVALLLLSATTWLVGFGEGERDVLSARTSLAIVVFCFFAVGWTLRSPTPREEPGAASPS